MEFIRITCYSYFMNLAENRKARFEYEVMDDFEAGIELLGFEAKAIRAGKANVTNAFVIVRGGEAYVIGMNIDPYQMKNTPKDYEPDANRKLLLSKQEIAEIAEKTDGQGLTAVVLALYSKGPRVKAKIAIVRGKKTHDKRETIKKRDLDRSANRGFDN
jgi:SsrA-binding protein